MISPRLCGGMLVAMPTAMPPAPLTSRFGNCAGRTIGSCGALVVVRPEVDRVLVDVGEQRVGGPGEAGLGVAHRRRRVAVHRAEVALAVDQRQAHHRSPGPCGPWRRRWRCRRAGDTCPSPRRRCAPTCGAAGRSRSRSRAWRRGCAAAPASARRARPAAPGSRSRSSRNRGTSASSPPRSARSRRRAAVGCWPRRKLSDGLCEALAAVLSQARCSKPGRFTSSSAASRVGREHRLAERR